MDVYQVEVWHPLDDASRRLHERRINEIFTKEKGKGELDKVTKYIAYVEKNLCVTLCVRVTLGKDHVYL
jgi:hypothetical protein